MLLADALVTADSSVTTGLQTLSFGTISFGTTIALSSFLILDRSGSPGGGDPLGGTDTDTLTPIMITVTMITDRRTTTNTGEA